ncbi:MAG: hypothetical protein KC584_18015, partial [Nitrospira sp.]|nr:hypothetical protein [Nitrospira sp.]
IKGDGVLCLRAHTNEPDDYVMNIGLIVSNGPINESDAARATLSQNRHVTMGLCQLDWAA